MQYLIEQGIKKETIDTLIKKYDESIIDQLQIEEYNVTEVIKYLKKIGIKVVDMLLVYRVELFTKDIETVKNAFLNCNIDNIVNLINEDVTNIDNL